VPHRLLETATTVAATGAGGDERLPLIIGALVAVAVIVAVVTVWFWLVTRPVDPVLEPLEDLPAPGRLRRRSGP
jgi:hypothetical protein